MNLWQWVIDLQRELRRNGQQRLAELIEQLPTLTCAGEHERVEAMVPEALALARALDHAWLEVFIRHWLMQSRILHRHDLAHGLDEVIHLLDYAHGERTRDCPQSVCVTQDVGVAYGVLDGPGYAEERLAVCGETLARIDPSWACFECISGEQATALIDARRFVEAEQFCRRQLQHAVEFGAARPWLLQIALAKALRAQGRPAEALVALEQAQEPRRDNSRHPTWRLEHCLTLAALGRGVEARALLPDAAALQHCDFVAWARSARRLVELEVLANDAALGATLRSFGRRLRNNGARWDVVLLARIGAQLALARGAPQVAALALAEVSDLLGQLRCPGHLAAQVEALQAQLEPHLQLPAEPADFEAWLENLDSCAERALPALLAARSWRPADTRVAIMLARAYRLLDAPERAEQLLRDHLASSPADEAMLLELAQLWLAEGRHEQLRALAATAPPAQQALANWFVGLSAERQGRLDEAVQALEQALALDPDAPAVQGLLALCYRRSDRPAAALQLLDQLVARSEPGDHDWERMVVATQLGEYAKLRDSAARLGFSFDGSGPIEEPLAYCDLRLREAHGGETVQRAMRVSPVTARIVNVAGPGRPEHYRDLVLFDPAPLNPPAENEAADADAEPRILEFRAISVLDPGGWRSYDLDGFHPGAGVLRELALALDDKLGAHLYVRSSEHYRLSSTDQPEPLPGLYAFIALPGRIDPALLLQMLEAEVADWELPVTYRSLVRELGLQAQLQRQEEIAAELGLDEFG